MSLCSRVSQSRPIRESEGVDSTDHDLVPFRTTAVVAAAFAHAYAAAIPLSYYIWSRRRGDKRNQWEIGMPNESRGETRGAFWSL